MNKGASFEKACQGLNVGKSCQLCLPNVERRFGRRAPEQRRMFWAVGLAVFLVAAVANQDEILSPGPVNPGHEAVDCTSCHLPATGSHRQQIQANLQKFMAGENTDAPFHSEPVDNSACEDCHDRKMEDRHPAFRFKEPRFKEARASVAPQYCVSCHQEHTGKRVANGGDFCGSCHREFEEGQKIKGPDHQALADQERFDTCLKCHDFHGNHRYKVPQELQDAFSKEAVLYYLDDGPSPFGDDKIHADREQ